MKKKIIISGANLFSGGTLSILEDCLIYADKYLSDEYDVFAYVYKKSLFPILNHVKIVEFPGIRKSYFHRFYNEYFHYKKITKDDDIFLWLSMNDMSAKVKAVHKAVYFHNPSPFRKPALMDLIGQPRWFLFTLFYKFLYKINIESNDYIIVQQDWLRAAFTKMFHLDIKKVIVAPPAFDETTYVTSTMDKNEGHTIAHFFYPTFPRPFKNIEVICKAANYIQEHTDLDFKITITIDGSENEYANQIVKKYKRNKHLNFIGLISRNAVFDYYAEADFLVFPSKLETWGLPISEFKNFKKPMILADLPYAHETLANYDQGCFFHPDHHVDLAKIMIDAIKKEAVFTKHEHPKPLEPTSNSWAGLFNILLN